MENKVKSLLLTLIFSAFIKLAVANDVLVTFTPNASDVAQGIVKVYDLYQQPTNGLAVKSYVFSIQAPTNFTSTVSMQFPASLMPTTNCNLYAQACNISQCGDFSAPYFYDYPALLAAVATNPPPVNTNTVANMKPQPVTGLGVKLILK